MKIYKLDIEVFLPKRETDILYTNLKLWKNKSFDSFSSAMASVEKISSCIAIVFGDFYNFRQRHGNGCFLYIRELHSIYSNDPFARITIMEIDYDK